MSIPNYEMMIKLKYKDGYIGPGLIKLVELSDQTGSMQEACAKMGMAYSKAWKIIKSAEKVTGYPILKRVTGGVGGGSSQLTDEGRKLVEDYKKFVEMTKNAADGFLIDIFDI